LCFRIDIAKSDAAKLDTEKIDTVKWMQQNLLR
jgi:hypothetical protein